LLPPSVFSGFSSPEDDHRLTDTPSISVADRAGIGAAGACAVHCFVAPWLSALLPLFGTAVASERTELLFLSASLIVSGMTLVVGSLGTHREWRPILVFLIGAGLLVAIRVTGQVEQPLGLLSIVCGACLLTAAHLLNVRCCRPIPPSCSCAASDS
jgi:hypothetical protein